MPRKIVEPNSASSGTVTSYGTCGRDVKYEIRADLKKDDRGFSVPGTGTYVDEDGRIVVHVGNDHGDGHADDIVPAAVDVVAVVLRGSDLVLQGDEEVQRVVLLKR